MMRYDWKWAAVGIAALAGVAAASAARAQVPGGVVCGPCMDATIAAMQDYVDRQRDVHARMVIMEALLVQAASEIERRRNDRFIDRTRDNREAEHQADQDRLSRVRELDRLRRDRQREREDDRRDDRGWAKEMPAVGGRW